MNRELRSQIGKAERKERMKTDSVAREYLGHDGSDSASVEKECAEPKPLPADLLYFHAQYRQASPEHGWTNQWKTNGDPQVDTKKNLNGEGNYVWLEASGRFKPAAVKLPAPKAAALAYAQRFDVIYVAVEKVK